MVGALAEGLCIGGIYALLALGFVMVLKSAMVINLAFGAQILLLAYLLAWMVRDLGWNPWMAMVVLVGLGIVLSLLIQVVFIRGLPGGDKAVLPMLILTLMLGSVIKGIAIIIWGGRAMTYPFTPSGLVEIGPISVYSSQLYSLITAIVVFLLLAAFFRYTNLGLAMRVASANRYVAESMGLPVKKIINVSWIASGIFSALAAILVGMVVMVNAEIDYLVLKGGFTALLLGGIFSIPGAVVGGLLIGTVERVGAHFAADYAIVIPWAVIVVMLLIRPWGLLGQKMVGRI